MSIEIKITDAYGMHASELRHMAAFLVSIAEARAKFCAETGAVPQKPARIDDVDNPATGTNAAEVFAGGANPADVFADGADPAKVFAQTGNASGADASSIAPAASTPATASIPPAPPSAAPGTAVAVELDKNGLPWDARIHASTKAKNVDGSWRNRRGVDAGTLAAVEAELRAVMGNAPVAGSPAAPAQTTQVAAPPPPPAAPEVGNVPPPPPPGAPTADTATGPASSMATPTSAPVSAPTPPASVPNAPPPPPAGVQAPPAAPSNVSGAASPDTASNAQGQTATITFPVLCSKITTALHSGSLTQARLAEVLAAHKLQGLPTLAAFPNLVQPVAAQLGFA